jgi:glycosyltransferase involved in cell wall biosynthesis
MRSPLSRARRLSARAVAKIRPIVRPRVVSQRNIRRFLKEARKRPPVRLPDGPPRTIAVVAACYKHAAYLPVMLQSIVAQTRLPDEVVFIDDASADGTAEILRAFIDSQPWLAGGKGKLLVNDRNIGQAASLNSGIAAASSELIMILNADDYLMHDAVEAMLRYYDDHRELALVGAHSIHFAGADVLAAAPKLSTDYAPPGLPLKVHRPEEVPHYRGYNDVNMTHSGSCFRKLAWEAVGGYRQRRDRCLPYSDRDFQILINALFPVGVAYETPYSFWRTDSSVDRGRES